MTDKETKKSFDAYVNLIKILKKNPSDVAALKELQGKITDSYYASWILVFVIGNNSFESIKGIKGFARENHKL